MKKVIISVMLILVASSILKSQYVIPCGGENGYDWRVETTQVISWSKYFMDTTQTIDIYLWNADSASYSIIATGVPIVNEFFLWKIPSSQELGEHFKIKIVYSGNLYPKFKYVSNDFFSIKEIVPVSQPQNPIIKKNKENNFTIIPNPTSDVIKIESSSKFFGFEIYDGNGSIVLSRRFDYRNSYQLTAKELASGTYIVQVRFMGNTSTQQLIIAR